MGPRLAPHLAGRRSGPARLLRSTRGRCSGPARPLRGTRRLGSLLIANSVEQEVRCVCKGGAARQGLAVRQSGGNRRQAGHRTAGQTARGVALYGGTAVTDGRGGGGLNGKGGAARRKERHGREEQGRRGNGRITDRRGTDRSERAARWREGEARVAAGGSRGGRRSGASGGANGERAARRRGVRVAAG